MDNLPKSLRRKKIMMKVCQCCNANLGIDDYAITNSLFYTDGHLPVCNSCIQDMLEQNDYNWRVVDKLCQYADIPFVPKEWERAMDVNPKQSFAIYSNLFREKEYENLQWDEYYKEFKALKDSGHLHDELPLLDEQKLISLTRKWGKAYDPSEFDYLENLLTGIMNTQNINGKLQMDQAIKLCKISLEIDHKIQEGVDFDKMLSSYDKLVKVAEFTPKNVKNINDLDSVGELFLWLEKAGYKCDFYNDVPKDVVDETMMNIEAWNQRLYANESGIGEEITRRIEALKTANEIEHKYDLDNKDADFDQYEVDGFTGLMSDDEEFDLGDD